MPGFYLLSILLLLNFYQKPPPGTILIENLFVDKTEISNRAWIEFLLYKSLELDSVEIKTLLPDSSNFWYRSYDNRDKPVVLISYDQAIAYCNWRSKVVSEKLDYTVVYRLPTKLEWIKIADYYMKLSSRKIKKEIARTKVKVQEASNEFTLLEIRDPKNRLYHYFTNVSEMTAKKGVAMGGNNYQINDTEFNPAQTFYYTSPNPYLGFRCVAEIKLSGQSPKKH